MLLMYYLNEKGERVYTLNKFDPNGKPTFSAHPARFSPADGYSKYRIIIKKRFKLLPTQQL
ncbi:H/ACA ribonucleoprotein complex subunit 3, partial [Stegodyphus mimosarum]